MQLQSDIRSILEAAILAPSGENAQPWRFSVQEKADGTAEIRVRIVKERDRSLYNWGNRASYFAAGASIENMRVAASGAGLSLSITIMPVPHDTELVAIVSCARTGKAMASPLEHAVYERCTNRKPYRTGPLSEEDREALMRSGTDADCGDSRLATDKESLRILARVGAGNEQMMLGNEALHDFFFDHLNWTREEDEYKKTGFLIDTFELQPPARMAFKVIRRWKNARLLNRFFRFNEIAAKQNAQTYAKASAMGVVAASGESPERAVRAGMLLERIWLEATLRGLSFQPMAGLLYLYLSARSPEGKESFSPKERRFIEARYDDAANVFNLKGKTLYFMFRLGKSGPPSARSPRFPLEDVVVSE